MNTAILHIVFANPRTGSGSRAAWTGTAIVMNRIESRDLIVWLAMGLLAGLIADLFVAGSAGLILNLIAGLVGSLLGGFLARTFNIMLNFGSVFIEQMVISIVGAIIVLALFRIF